MISGASADPLRLSDTAEEAIRWWETETATELRGEVDRIQLLAALA